MACSPGAFIRELYKNCLKKYHVQFLKQKKLRVGLESLKVGVRLNFWWAGGGMETEAGFKDCFAQSKKWLLFSFIFNLLKMKPYKSCILLNN